MNPLAEELHLVAIALVGPWRKPPSGPGTFGTGADSGRGALIAGIVVALAFEAFPVHVMLASRNPKLAWLVTASNLYLILWLIGDQQALRLSRSRITSDAIELRVGMRCRATVPYSAIAAVRTRELDSWLARKDTVRAVVKPTAPTLVLELAHPVVVRGRYGISRNAGAIALAPDERAEVVAALAAAGAPVDPV